MPRKTEFIDVENFKKFLDNQKGERGISKFLKGAPALLYWTMCVSGGHKKFVFKEFPIGNQYKADYVILNTYSGLWQVKFIELESISDKIFTKANKPTKVFSDAIKQIDDWRTYFDNHKDEVRNQLIRWAKSKDLLKSHDSKLLSNYSGNRLEDPNTVLQESFHVFIGRRNTLSESQHSRKALYLRNHRIDVVSYDRLLDLAKVRYKKSNKSLFDRKTKTS